MKTQGQLIYKFNVHHYSWILATCVNSSTIDVALTILKKKWILVSVRGQVVSCKASVNCTGGLDNDLGMEVDGRSCCLDNQRALAYVPSDGSCVACVGESQIDETAVNNLFPPFSHTN